MFFSFRSLGALALLLFGLIFGFAWYLTKAPTPAELADGQDRALTYLLRSFDEDKHFVTRYGIGGAAPTVTREEQFAAELEAATVLADASRKDSALAAAHRENLGIILTDWYTGTGETSFLANGAPTMEENGRALVLLSESPLFEEQRDKAEKLAATIASWAQRDFTMYWKAASTTPAESLGYGILGIASLYLRTGASDHKETLELLAARYRLLLDVSPLRLTVRGALYEALRSDEDRRGLLLAANSFLPLQNKNFIAASYGLFKDAAGAYYPAAEQAMIVEGLAHASLLAAETDSKTSLSLKQAALRGASGLLRMQMSAPEKLDGGVLGTIKGDSVETYATAHLYSALEALR